MYLMILPSTSLVSRNPFMMVYTDADGRALVNANIEVNGDAPGTLNAIFREKFMKRVETLASIGLAFRFIRTHPLREFVCRKEIKPEACYLPIQRIG